VLSVEGQARRSWLRRAGPIGRPAWLVNTRPASTVEGRATQRSVLDELEARYPVLRGTMRDHVTQQRRAFLRFFACEQDLSHEQPDAPLPDAVASGAEPFFVVGAVAGG
jgi:hypothetical protein